MGMYCNWLAAAIQDSAFTRKRHPHTHPHKSPHLPKLHKHISESLILKLKGLTSTNQSGFSMLAGTTRRLDIG